MAESQFIKKLIGRSGVVFVLLAEILLGVVLSIFSLYVFVEFTENALSAEAMIYDNFISDFVYGLRTPFITEVMIIISKFSAGYVFFAFSLVVLYLIWKKHKNDALFFFIILLMGLLLNNFLKLVIQRERPLISPLTHELTYSFPSGHAMNGFIFYVTIAYFFYRFTKKKTLTLLISVFCFLMVILVGFSRIYLGVHYPTDVLAGYVIGFWWFVTALLIEKTLIFFKLLKLKKINN